MTVTFTSGTTRYSLITRPVGLLREEPVILPDPSCKPRFCGRDGRGGTRGVHQEPAGAGPTEVQAMSDTTVGLVFLACTILLVIGWLARRNGLKR